MHENISPQQKTIQMKGNPGSLTNKNLSYSRTNSIMNQRTKNEYQSSFNPVGVVQAINTLSNAIAYFESKQEIKNNLEDRNGQEEEFKSKQDNSNKSEESIDFEEYYSMKEQLRSLRDENEKLQKVIQELNENTKRSINKAAFMQTTLEDILAV